MKQYIADKCEIVCEDNGKKMFADILNFKEEQYLSVSLEKTLKLDLKWNGNIFEGKLGRMSFVSNGPKIQTVKNSR